jgi:hypothetical protein
VIGLEKFSEIKLFHHHMRWKARVSIVEKKNRETQTVATGTASHHRDVLLHKGRDAQFHGNLRSRNS